MARPAPTNCENVAADHVAPIKNQAFTETGLEHFSTQILYGLYNTAQHPIAMLYHLWHTGEQGVRDYQRDNHYQRGQVWGAGLFGVGSFVASDGLLDGDVLAGEVERSATGMLSRAEQDALKARILANPESAIKSNFMSHVARVDQISGGYNPDVWEMTVLHKGDVVYGGLPGQSHYYTDLETILASQGDKKILGQNLQVRPHELHGYRSGIGQYNVLRDMRIPVGLTSANPELGSGMAKQLFLSNYANNLSLMNEFDLEEFYEQQFMSTYTSGR